MSEEENKAAERVTQLEEDLANVLDENGELERRLSIIIATATGEQEYDVADKRRGTRRGT